MKKQILLILGFTLVSVQFSCTSKATSTEISQTEVQEIIVTRNVSAPEFNKFLQEKQNAIILDVRTPAEVAEGYIKGAVNIDINDTKFRSELSKLDKSKPVLVYCRSGRRSAAAMRHMRDNGFLEVYNLKGGIIAWGQEGLKIAKQ